MLDFPLPLSPVIALKQGSKFGTTTLWAYDLNPSIVISSIYIGPVAKTADRRDSGLAIPLAV